MKTVRLCLLPLALLLMPACADWSSGCQPVPVEQALPQEALGRGSLEFYLPDYRLEVLGTELLDLLEQDERAFIEASLPALEGVLNQGPSFVGVPTKLRLILERLTLERAEGGILMSLVVSSGQGELELEIQGPDEQPHSCTLTLDVPMRQTALMATMGYDESGLASLVADGQPYLEGSPVTITPGPECYYQTAADFGAVDQALEDAIQEGLTDLVDALTARCGQAMGVRAGGSGLLGESFVYQLFAYPELSLQSLDETRISLAGGFDSHRASCMPADLPRAEPVFSDPAAFEEVLPSNQEPYSMALSLSLDYLTQGLTAAYRSGLLCRKAGAGDVPLVDLEDLLPSLQSLAPGAKVRAAVWPRGALRVDYTQPADDGLENLPRLKLSLVDLYLDIYALIDGADLRVLGLRADVTLDVGASLEQGQLSFWLADAQVTGLDVLFHDLLAEQAGTLRIAATQVVNDVAASLIDHSGPFSLSLPQTAGAQLLEFRLQDNRLILYF